MSSNSGNAIKRRIAPPPIPCDVPLATRVWIATTILVRILTATEMEILVGMIDI
jgi:hypothetical protein